MLILAESWLAISKKNRVGLVCVNAGNNKVGD
jgi:hypothetical protein